MLVLVASVYIISKIIVVVIDFIICIQVGIQAIFIPKVRS